MTKVYVCAHGKGLGFGLLDLPASATGEELLAKVILANDRFALGHKADTAVRVVFAGHEEPDPDADVSLFPLLKITARLSAAKGFDASKERAFLFALDLLPATGGAAAVGAGAAGVAAAALPAALVSEKAAPVEEGAKAGGRGGDSTQRRGNFLAAFAPKAKAAAAKAEAAAAKAKAAAAEALPSPPPPPVNKGGRPSNAVLAARAAAAASAAAAAGGDASDDDVVLVAKGALPPPKRRGRPPKAIVEPAQAASQTAKARQARAAQLAAARAEAEDESEDESESGSESDEGSEADELQPPATTRTIRAACGTQQAAAHNGAASSAVREGKVGAPRPFRGFPCGNCKTMVGYNTHVCKACKRPARRGTAAAVGEALQPDPPKRLDGRSREAKALKATEAAAAAKAGAGADVGDEEDEAPAGVGAGGGAPAAAAAGASPSSMEEAASAEAGHKRSRTEGGGFFATLIRRASGWGGPGSGPEA